MIAHARLVVIGGDSHRLHEEIITAGGSSARGPLRPARTSARCDDALAAATADEPVRPRCKERLDALWPSTPRRCCRRLEARTDDRTESLETRRSPSGPTRRRGDITAILTELRRAIEAELDDPTAPAARRCSPTPSASSSSANVDALRRRLTQIPSEIERETAAIRARFADPQPRLFPVAVTFLVPRSWLADGSAAMSIARHHAEWLSLVEVSGPFLILPVLLRVFPQGLDAHDPEHAAATCGWPTRSGRDQDGKRPTRPSTAWIDFVLGADARASDDVLAEGQAIPPDAQARRRRARRDAAARPGAS